MISIGEVLEIAVWAHINGCKISALPTKCLGWLFGASCKSKVIWEQKLEGWKELYLLEGDRITLIE